MNKNQSSIPGGIEESPRSPDEQRAAKESGVVSRDLAARLRRLGARPSWDEVNEYLCEGKHGERVEQYALLDRDFADVVRSMRNDLEDEEGGSCQEPPGSGARVYPFPAPRSTRPSSAS